MTTSLQLAQDPFESQMVLLLDDDQTITEGLAAGLEREGRTLITCNDIESAELMVDRYRPSHIVADIRISGSFGCEGLEFIRYARRHAPDSHVILISGSTPDAMRAEASRRGAGAFLAKPFLVAELDDVLNGMPCATWSRNGDDEASHIHVPMIDEVLRSGDVHPFFQPIVALDGSDRPVGYESLARYRSDSPLRNPEMLFRYAAKKGRIADLELACINGTLAVAHALPPESLLFINIHPDAFMIGPRLVDSLVESAGRCGVPLDRIVLEITEQCALPDIRLVSTAVERLRALGVRFAFDDVGVAYSHLPLIGQLRPSFLKISQDFGTRFERDSVKSKIVRNIVSLAHDFGCDVIIEGIEDRSTADAAARLHIPFGQGYLFGRPTPAGV